MALILVMGYLKNKFNSLFLIAVFVLISFSNIFLSGLIHRHEEINLHFHAENLLTKDHTVAVDKDCSLCEVIVNSTNYLFQPVRNAIFTIQFHTYTSRNKFCFFFSKHFFKYLGRAPPCKNS